MNRQVLPSMVLSVLIVCFFAVVLFPVERDRPARDQTAEPPIAPQPRDAAPIPPETATKAPSPPTDEPPVPAVAREPAEPRPSVASAAPAPTEPAAPLNRLATPSAGPVASTRIPEPPPPAPFSPSAPVAADRAGDAPPARRSSKRPALADVANRPDKPAEASPEPRTKTDAAEPRPPPAPPAAAAEAVSIPRGDVESTIVDAGETLDDVAFRVYGTRAGAETLLRANREVLSHRKGPLRTGLQLWTPAR